MRAVMVGAIVHFLAKYPPFNEMDAATLRYLASHVLPVGNGTERLFWLPDVPTLKGQ